MDHGLRDGSAAEANHVATLCAGLGCPHDTLTLTDLVPGPNLQARARDARYEAMKDWAGTVGCNAVLLGHTADDVAETLVLRLRRGAGITPIEDQSNEDPSFDRIAVRHAMASLGLDVATLCRSATALGEARDTLDHRMRVLARELIREDRGDLIFALAPFSDLFASEPEHARRLHAPELSVGALGDDINSIDWRATGLPRKTVMASPAVRRGDSLIAVPIAGWSEGWDAFPRVAFAQALIRR